MVDVDVLLMLCLDVQFILNKGRVQMERTDKQGEVQVLEILYKGSHFGEKSMLWGTPRSETVCDPQLVVARVVVDSLFAGPIVDVLRVESA